MGQYYLTVNLDKKQYLMPHDFGDGLKLLEFACSANGILAGLAILLADGNNRGGGDLRSTDPIIGSWAGDRIVITGDYADEGKFLEEEDGAVLQAIANEHYSEGYQQAERVNLYAYAKAKFENISAKVIAALMDDGYLHSRFTERFESRQCFAPDGEGYPEALRLREQHSYADDPYSALRV